jgi:hypothetical protein
VSRGSDYLRAFVSEEFGFAMLLGLGVTLIAAVARLRFWMTARPPSRSAKSILGAVAELDKAMTVAKLKGARNRVRRRAGKCEGRKSYAERDPARHLKRGDVALRVLRNHRPASSIHRRLRAKIISSNRSLSEIEPVSLRRHLFCRERNF